ncbi:MAG: PhoH family protein, partial [Acidimicrobiales bacterium]
LNTFLEFGQLKRMIDADVVEICPLAYMRGRTLDEAFIILDEAQNTSPEQMKMFLTRLGFGSKMVVTGDVTQIDLPNGTDSGLKIVEGILDGLDDVHFCRLSSHDVVRHRLVGRIVDAYSRYDAEQVAGRPGARDTGRGPRRGERRRAPGGHS